MKLRFNFGTSAAVFPMDVLKKKLSSGISPEELKLMIAISENPGISFKKLISETKLDADECAVFISEWEKLGALVTDTEADKSPPLDLPEQVKQRKAKIKSEEHISNSAKNNDDSSGQSNSAKTKKLLSAADIPDYSTEELAKFLESRQELTTLVDSCQQIMGKIFNTSETAIIVGIADYLDVDFEYIKLLCAYCVQAGHRSMRYLEKTAISLYDSGITDYSLLEEKLKELSLLSSNEGMLRKIFGIENRSLTSQQKQYFSTWVGKMEFPIDVISHAYEIAVDSTGKPALPYINKILENWHTAGYRTIDDIKSAEEAYKLAKSNNTAQPGQAGSFNTNDFFEAALKRSYNKDA